MYLLVENSSITIAYLYIWYDRTCPDDIAQEFVHIVIQTHLHLHYLFNDRSRVICVAYFILDGLSLCLCKATMKCKKYVC